MNSTKAEAKEETSRLNRLFNVDPDRINYFVNFSTRFSYIYVETPKAACSTIKRRLQLAEVDEDVSRVPEDVHARNQSPLKQIRRASKSFWHLYDDPTTFRFCFVRNPFSRALSCYLDKLVQDKSTRPRIAPQLGLPADRIVSFRVFLSAVRDQTDHERNPHWAPQAYLLSPERFRYSFIGRFEFLQRHLDLVARRLGFPKIPRQRVAPHATSAAEKIDAYYGPKEIALVQDIYQQDFEAFGYGWSPDIL